MNENKIIQNAPKYTIYEKEITDKATDEALLIVENASDEIKTKIEEGVVDRVKELDKEVEIKKKELEEANASLVAELKVKKEALEKKSAELEEKLKTVIAETAKLEEDRSSFKSSMALFVLSNLIKSWPL